MTTAQMTNKAIAMPIHIHFVLFFLDAALGSGTAPVAGYRVE
jgi:hypothetical protein